MEGVAQIILEMGNDDYHMFLYHVCNLIVATKPVHPFVRLELVKEESLLLLRVTECIDSIKS